MDSKITAQDITVGFCTYNRPSTIGRALEAVLANTVLPKEIIIFDSSEDDETEKLILLINSPLVRYVHENKRVILPKARNKVVDLTQTRIISFLDDDAIVKKEFITSLIDSFNTQSVIGVTGPTINATHDLQPTERLIFDDKNRTAVYPWGEVRTDTRRWISPRPLPCKVMIGANMAYYTQDIRRAGGFDEKLLNPSFREETDLQIRIKKLRSGIFLYHPHAHVWHLVKTAGGIEDIEEKRKRYFYLAGKNHRHFADKHFSKIFSRLSWILWSRNPPCLWLAIFLTLIRHEPCLSWHRGLWEKEK